MRLASGDYFVIACAALQCGAAVSYALRHQWPVALMWLCYAIASLSTLLITTSQPR